MVTQWIPLPHQDKNEHVNKRGKGIQVKRVWKLKIPCDFYIKYI